MLKKTLYAMFSYTYIRIDQSQKNNYVYIPLAPADTLCLKHNSTLIGVFANSMKRIRKKMIYISPISKMYIS